MDKERYIIAAVRKAGDVLKTVANSREPLTPTQIAEQLDMDTNAAFRQCVTLETIGWLRQIGDKYELGMGLALFWARKRAQLEATVKRAQTDIMKLDDPGPMDEIFDAGLSMMEEMLGKKGDSHEKEQ
jgi:hypothetical protein